MNKNKSIFLMFITILLGSVITFYSVNLLMSDLSNMFYGVHDIYFISSIPLFMIALDFVLLYIFLLRFTRYQEYKKALIKLYSTFLIFTSIIGIATSIVTGTTIYGSFIKPYPFTGYTIICLIVNSLLFIIGIYIKATIVKKMDDDKEKRHMKLKYVLYSLIIFLLILYAFNKFGALLLSPIYVQKSTLYLTIYFYLSLISPIAIVWHITTYMLDGYKGKELLSLVVISFIGVISVALSVTVFILGAKYPEFISAISPCLPLERLATMPIGTVSQFFVILGFSIYYIIYSVISLKRAK